MRFNLIILLPVIVCSILISTSCGSTPADTNNIRNDPTVNESGGTYENFGEDVDGQLIFDRSLELEYANNFTLDFYKGGYIIFKSTASKQEYLIVPENKSVPKDIAEEVKILYAPLSNLYIDSSAMVSLISSFDGGLDSLKIVTTDKDGWYLGNVAVAMDDGRIKYGGKYSSPDYEIMLRNGIQLCICTTMLSSNPDVQDKFNELGIPYFIESSSYENHPLARMEWIKLMGIICGREAEATEVFNEQKEIIDSVSSSQSTGIKTAVFYYSADGKKIYLRNSGDYIAQMLRLAGGVYAAEDLKPGESGTTTVTSEEFFKIVSDADYIFYMNYYTKFTSMEKFIEFNEIHQELKAVQNKKIWYTSPDFSQKANALGDIIADMNKILISGENIDTDYLIYMK